MEGGVPYRTPYHRIILPAPHGGHHLRVLQYRYAGTLMLICSSAHLGAGGIRSYGTVCTLSHTVPVLSHTVPVLSHPVPVLSHTLPSYSTLIRVPSEAWFSLHCHPRTVFQDSYEREDATCF